MPPRSSRSCRQVDAPEPSYTVQADNITVDLGSHTALDCYKWLLDREIIPQAWTPSRTPMRELHIYDDVHALFANIGWERLSSADFATSPLTLFTWTSYVLSSISPITSLSHPTPAFDVCELETIKSVKAEFFLLWCMITNLHRPHFGDIIIKRFHKVISLHTGGAIRCGGLISIIACAIVAQSPLGYTFFAGDSFRLTLQTLRAMHMFCTAPGGYVWMQVRSTYFKVTGPDDITLVDPISDTVWVLQSNIPQPLRQPRT
ncbi:unnamed protein product [Lactuca saligna]|uniref:Uncharacterized protein n=1 Tax=Lactuca saligna TaxID=75948 RepID=A0AA35Z6U9_LACSI|nr:unnamed protein product [Lactuca saligna]